MLSIPNENVNLPENLQKALVDAQNKLTVQEAELIRLRELTRSQEYAVTQLHNQLKELEEKIAELETVKKAKQLEVDSLNERKNLIYSEINVASSELDLATQKTKEQLALLEQKAVVFAEKEQSLETRTKILKESEDLLNEEKKFWEEKIKRIQDALT